MAASDLRFRRDPLVVTVLGEARCDPVLYKKLVWLAAQNDLTVFRGNVLHLSDNAMEAWYQSRESKTNGNRML